MTTSERHHPPFRSHRLEAIEPLTSLTAEQLDLLDDALRQDTHLADVELRVYRCDDEVFVAPEGASVRIGSRVIASRSIRAPAYMYEDGTVVTLSITDELVEQRSQGNGFRYRIVDSAGGELAVMTYDSPEICKGDVVYLPDLSQAKVLDVHAGEGQAGDLRATVVVDVG